MRDIPLLLTDFMRAIEKLPDPNLFKGPSEISIVIKDSITELDRHLLFFRKAAVVKKGEEPTPFWTLWQNIAVNSKFKEKK